MENQRPTKRSRVVLYEPNIKYLITNDVVLYCPKSIANYFDLSYNYILKIMDKLKDGIIEFSNNVLMLTFKGAYSLVSYIKAPIRKKRSAIRELLNEDIINIMY